MNKLPWKVRDGINKNKVSHVGWAIRKEWAAANKPLCGKQYARLRQHYWVNPTTSLCFAEGGRAKQGKEHTSHERCKKCVKILDRLGDDFKVILTAAAIRR